MGYVPCYDGGSGGDAPHVAQHLENSGLWRAFPLLLALSDIKTKSLGLALSGVRKLLQPF
ncbi:MAG TPA: hypothetical protein VGI46_21570 [Candidatus Acidoferrum sp.]|jgi:hypothetical protein